MRCVDSELNSGQFGLQPKWSDRDKFLPQLPPLRNESSYIFQEFRTVFVRLQVYHVTVNPFTLNKFLIHFVSYSVSEMNLSGKFLKPMSFSSVQKFQLLKCLFDFIHMNVLINLSG